ncbi:extracellular matrix-binding protein ebh isoform X1 [Neodiprion fabricii]|uniref:extracellular matrix-binding protein ebh isoform X1 n=1 Tax=Neodiprion fabricii TaxID=2872261 RepID=UPI001ED8FE43|nr:extracellular matrix-binding protein ebh isoform X1 [Neodiprion fabricii]
MMKNPCRCLYYQFADIETFMDLTSNCYRQCSSGSTEGGVVSGGGGMDCLPLRPGPFHYLISEQAKSLVALQELQNEVGALLEFRDLVIETFPNLRHKMAASASPASSASVMSTTNIPLQPLTSPSSRRIAEWEPGRVRRRAPREGESSSSLPRSRSNSHSGGNKHSATVQDSGFSTETSSKDSASTAIPRPPSPRPVLDEAEDELWNLLDVIHRRGTRLREEVECLQGRLESAAPEELGLSDDVLEAVRKVARPEESARIEDDDKVQVTALRREKEHLIDKVTELEAETISSRVRAQELQSELEALAALRNGLEDRLRAEIESKREILHAPGPQRIVTDSPPPISSPKSPGDIRSNVSAFACVGSASKSHKNRFRTRTIEKNVIANINNQVSYKEASRNADDDVPKSNDDANRCRLGRLDSVLISPKDLRRPKNVDSKKIVAILHEHSPIELQRHLITTTVHNQTLQERLNEAEKNSEILTDRLDKTREENDDLRFQLAERNIELEGTRARVRVLERFQHRPPTEVDLNDSDIETARGSDQGCLEPGSSTESARDHHQEMVPSPRRRPSRIPLPGAKQTAPKPPTHGRNNSRESLKSLTRQPRDSSRDSLGGKSFSKTRDSSRESLSNKSLPRTTGNAGSGSRSGNLNNSINNKDQTASASKDSLNRSLPRHNNYNCSPNSRDSLNKSSSSLSRGSVGREARDSLESGGVQNVVNSPGTPPRRPPAPARRAHSLARPSVESDTGKGFTDPPSSWCSTSGSFRHSESSLYPDSLNQETSSVTGSTRVEFILGSPTRHFRTSSAVWPPRYFDSIDSAALIAESLTTDEFPLRRGEALAECDSLESHPISSDA